MPGGPEDSLGHADRFAHALHVYLCDKYKDECLLTNDEDSVEDPCPSCRIYRMVGF